MLKKVYERNVASAVSADINCPHLFESPAEKLDIKNSTITASIRRKRVVKNLSGIKKNAAREMSNSTRSNQPPRDRFVL